MLRFEDDVLGHFDCALDCANRHELEVVGWDGTLLLHDPWHSLEPVIEVRAADGSVERVEAERENPYALRAARPGRGRRRRAAAASGA